MPRRLQANALLTRHCWHSSMSGYGWQSIMGASWWSKYDCRWQQNMCSSRYMCLFRSLEFFWTKDPLLAHNASFFCSRVPTGCGGTKSRPDNDSWKPMTKAINNGQELHWNKSLSNPTKVDTKKKNLARKIGCPVCSQEGNFYGQML